MGPLFKSLPKMKNHLPANKASQNEVERPEDYSLKLMKQPEQPPYELAHKINQIIVNGDSALTTLHDIAAALGMAFNVDCCCLVTLTDSDLDESLCASWCYQEFLGLPNSEDIFSTEQLDLPVVQCAAEPLTIEDISTIENSLLIGCRNLTIPIKSVLAIPTRKAGKNNGVVCLIKSQPYDWSQQEKLLLKALESYCAIAFSQFAQSQAQELQRQFVLKSDQHQSLIKQLTILSRSNLELNQMLQLATASAAESMQADRGLLLLLKYTDPLFRTRRQQIPKAKVTVVSKWSKDTDLNITTQTDGENSFLLSECSLCQRAYIESGKHLIFSDNTEKEEALTVAPIFAANSFPTIMLIPLESQGRILGFLVLQQASPRRWQIAELNILEMVCAQLSNAIIQSQTLRQVQTLVDDRTAQLQRSLEVQAKLYEKTRQYVEQLRELNVLKDEFLSNISDRLRYPLTNMRMAIRNLRQPNIPPERQVKYLDILEQQCTQEINLINDLLTMQKLDTHQAKPQFETINLNTKVQDIVKPFEKKLADKNLSIQLDLPEQQLELQTEVESLDRILHELLTNASKFSQHHTTIELVVSHQVNQLVDQVIIKVINTGRGISSEEANYIFDRFRRGKGRWTPGTGLGLALVKSLTQHLNGTVSVESKPIEDSDYSSICFALTLPQYSDDSKP